MAINEDENNIAEARAPLITKQNNAAEEEYSKEDRWMVYLSTIVAVWGSFEFGCCIGFSSPTQSAIRQDLNFSLAEYALFGSILNFGAVIGAITSGTIADFIGRKGAMRVSSISCAVGWLAIYFAKGAVAMDFGRLATGYGMGLYSYVVPVYIAEIAPKDLRGSLTTLNQLLIVTGVSAFFVIGTVLTWRVLALTGLIPCAVMLLALFLIPESPRWLAKTGQQKEFMIALQSLRGKNANISQEAADIQDNIKTLEQLPKSNLLDLFQRQYLRSITVAFGLMMFQQLGGINGICFYVSSIFESAGFPSDVGTTIYAVLQVVVTGIGALLMDKAGRKPLFVISASGLALGSILAGMSFYLKEHGETLREASPLLAVTGILVYIGSFSIGMGAIPWVVMSEIFPIHIKGLAGSLAALVNWTCSWGMSYTFNFLMSWSSYGTFFIFAAVNALAVLFEITLVPETKGRTLEEIQAELGSN